MYCNDCKRQVTPKSRGFKYFFFWPWSILIWKKRCPICNGTNLVKTDEPTSKKRKWWIIAASIAALIIIAAALSEKEKEKGPVSNSQREANVPTEAGKAGQDSIPEKQKSFSQVVMTFVGKYKSAANELKKSAVRTERKIALKDALNSSYEIVDWIGTLKDMGTTSERNAYVSIQPDGCNFRVQTWNNELSDISGNTLIPQGTELYKKVADLDKGNRVLFSGHFVPGEDDFVQEQSVTEQGSMTDPEFTVIFTSIKKK